MKIIVFSDSHGMTDKMKHIADKERPDMIFHLGDHEYDCESLFGNIRIVKVRGNCDYGSSEKTERFLDFGTSKIWMTHGHLYGVKNGLATLLKKGEELGADLILYGHTHQKYLLKTDRYTVMNPGTPTTGYGIIHMENGKIQNVELTE